MDPAAHSTRGYSFLRLSLNDVIITRLPAADKQPWNIMKTSFTHGVEEQRSASPDDPPRAALSLILIDDHAILRDGLRALFSDESDVELIGEAATVADGIALARQLRPDVVITDISFPVGSGRPGRLARPFRPAVKARSPSDRASEPEHNGLPVPSAM